MSNTRMSTIARLLDLENEATGALLDRLNASANQPAAYPVMARAANVVEEIITVAIDRIVTALGK